MFSLLRFFGGPLHYFQLSLPSLFLLLRFWMLWFQVVRKLAWPRQLQTRAIPPRLRPLLLPSVQRWPLHVHWPQLCLDGDERRAGSTVGQLSFPAEARIHVQTYSTADHAAVSSSVLGGVLVFCTCVLSLMSLGLHKTCELNSRRNSSFLDENYNAKQIFRPHEEKASVPIHPQKMRRACIFQQLARPFGKKKSAQ